MRMIDADELKNQVRHMPRTINPDLVRYRLVQAIIENMPTLTPPNEWVEVRHGYWYDCGSLSCRCSKCGCKNNRETAYCPSCGACMDKEN